jgi:hypothetical protein
MMADADPRRDAALKRLKAKRAFSIHAAMYGIVNVLLIVVWAVSGSGYFWPIWPIAGWGIGLAAHAYVTYAQKPITEEDIRREMERGG